MSSGDDSDSSIDLGEDDDDVDLDLDFDEDESTDEEDDFFPSQSQPPEDQRIVQIKWDGVFDENRFIENDGYRGGGEVLDTWTHIIERNNGKETYEFLGFRIKVSYIYKRKFKIAESGSKGEERFRHEGMLELKSKYPNYKPEAKGDPTPVSPDQLARQIGVGSSLYRRICEKGEERSVHPKENCVFDFFGEKSFFDIRYLRGGDTVLFSTKGDSFFLEDCHLPRIGVVEELELFDFMNHNNFYMKFHPNVNFIVGYNGAGKSAILAGIRVGLGATAKNSQRGQRLGDLIRDGASSSTIRIRLKNEGQLAFRPRVYGDSITVERTLKKESGSYALFRDDGKKVPDVGKREIDAALKQLKVEINNPCAVMTQEMSKSFITTTSDDERYNLFLTCTQLYQLNEDYSEARANIDDMNDKLENRSKTLRKIETELEKLSHQLELVKHLSKQKAELEGLQTDLVWAPIVENEAELESDRAGLPKFDSVLEKLESRLAKKEHEKKIAKDHFDELMADFQEKKEQEEKGRVGLIETKKELKIETIEIGKLGNLFSDKTKRLNAHSQKLKKVLATIAEQQRRMRESYQTQVEMCKEKTKKLEREKEENEAETVRVNAEHNRVHSDFLKLDEAFRDEQSKKRAGEKEVEQIDQNLKKLESTRGRKDPSRFGRECGDIFHAIQRNRHLFRKIPIGPIGMHLTLKDTTWGEAVEHSIGDLLKFFLVDNHEDERTLKKLTNSRLSLIVQSFRETSYPNIHHPTKVKNPTVYSVLNCDNPMVLNALVDQRGIERIVLVEDTDEGNYVVEKEQGIEARTKEGGVRLFVRNGARSTTRPPALHSLVLSGNMEDQIKYCQKMKDHTQQKLYKITEEVKGKEKEVQNARNLLRQTEVKLNKLGAAANIIDRNIRETKDELEDIMRQANPDTSELVEAEERLKSEISDLNEELQNIQKEVEEKKKELQKKKKEKESQQRDYEDRKELLDDVTERIESIQADVETIKKREAVILEQKGGLLREKQKFQKDLDERAQKIEFMIKKVMEKHPERRNPKMKEAQIQKKIAIIQRNIQAEEEKHDSEESLVARKVSLMSRQKHAIDEMAELKRIKSCFRNMIVNRIDDWKKLRNTKGKEIAMWFSYYLLKRNFTGHLDFDHKNKRLKIEIMESMESKNTDVGGKKDKRTARSLAGLSGGERSYSTVCLLLAMWSDAAGNFRAMDEFDVFMDAGNREVAITALLGMCQSQISKQFILITPNKQQLLKSSTAWVKIHELQPPRAIQHLIGFASQQ